MSQRIYSLVTRSAALLILALLLAPVWDSWRYRGLANSGGATFPVGAILTAPGRAPGVAAVQARTTTNQPPTTGVPTASASLASLHPPTQAWVTPNEAALPSGPRSVGSAFDAWTARAQVDPFWNGETATPPPAVSLPDGASTTRTDAAARDGSEGAGARRRDAAAATAAAAPGPAPTTEKRRAVAVGADPDDDDAAEGPARADETSVPGDTGVLAGVWPLLQAAPGTEPLPTPPPPDSGPATPPRVYSPHPRSGDPKPVPVPVPVVTAQVATPEVAVGDTLLIAIQIENADQVTSLPFHLGFDPAVIEFAGSQVGSALAIHDPVLLASVSPNRPGDLAVGLSLIESAGTFTGTGDVVILQFHALAVGRTDLSFSRATLRGARSEPLEVRFAGGTVTVR